MDKLQIKLKNGESLYISIEGNGHAHIEDIARWIETSVEDNLGFVTFEECIVVADQIVYVKPIDDDVKSVDLDKKLKEDNPNLKGAELEKLSKKIFSNGVPPIKDMINKDITPNIQIKQTDFTSLIKKK
ncbi:MAG TPA: hypothetical protein VEY70_19625 [Metabacillus sp.]|nr:hypothetical protein [Metabacillus sp.]